MKHSEAAALLEWAAPRLGLRARGFRNVGGQVCKRIARRSRELGLASLRAYRERLQTDPEEWRVLQRLCFVTISRFYRDGGVWETLRTEVLPQLAAAARAEGERTLHGWSLGCASGEEPYTLSLLWALTLAEQQPELELHILATELDAEVLERARAALYSEGSLQELPAAWRARAFERAGAAQRLRAEFRARVELRLADARQELPERQFRLILCRNVVFTYFDESLQRGLLEQLVRRLRPGGALVLGKAEQLPPGAALEVWRPEYGIYRRGEA